MIHVIAAIELKPGARAEYLEIFRRLVPSVLAEEGCLDYGPTVDLATSIAVQVPPRPDTVIVVEKWTGLEALQAHSKTPHMDDYRAKVKDLVTGVSLQVLEPA